MKQKKAEKILKYSIGIYLFLCGLLLILAELACIGQTGFKLAFCGFGHYIALFFLLLPSSLLIETLTDVQSIKLFMQNTSINNDFIPVFIAIILQTALLYFIGKKLIKKYSKK